MWHRETTRSVEVVEVNTIPLPVGCIARLSRMCTSDRGYPGRLLMPVYPADCPMVFEGGFFQGMVRVTSGGDMITDGEHTHQNVVSAIQAALSNSVVQDHQNTDYDHRSTADESDDFSNVTPARGRSGSVDLPCHDSAE